MVRSMPEFVMEARNGDKPLENPYYTYQVAD